MQSTSHGNSTTIELPFKRPFDWTRLLAFIGGRAAAGVESVEGGVYRRAIEWHGDEGTVEVRPHERKHRLVVTVDGNAQRHADELAEPLARMFDLHADPRRIASVLSRDPLLAPLLDASPGLRVPGAWSGFELVVRTIVGQQVSVKGASTIMGRIVQRAGRMIDGHSHEATAWRFPTPAELAAADLDKIGMPTKRVEAVQRFANAVSTGALPLDEPDADAEALKRDLLALPGIGPWTVGYVAMRALRDPDAWPDADLVLMQAIARRNPALLKPAQQRAHIERWRPWRAYAAVHLWNGVAMETGAARGG
ncbi:AlkA N-terminal domain-containing protein [Caballeronia sp. LP006]|uniref:DNA-3-methyladenine glycosylase family protein n=1 Tax=unclassified Caballeronia TaxID=2646786 RepID=UPI00285A6E8E|nr:MULTISPECIES: AlkA N-terminal domain-containing protein [unclassified Caballeronia]MDR5774311.1 AlkA N-terminal domain-containing protein [Caballeronia sp. LZ002]MDR5805844.1 AlkA N-terminal domain-containing protein [Caballeronia sp. LZ001]MDR5827089.1 AlkA N-terminal domain-containing protein [Caballeronia sp. LP006]MDR5849746.1 AlkA N-terminal domain-containing protein [Caballeronia sp. LZ003]